MMPKRARRISDSEIQALLLDSDCEIFYYDEIDDSNNDNDYTVSEEFGNSQNCALGDFPPPNSDPCDADSSDSDEEDTTLVQPKTKTKKSDSDYFCWKNIGNDVGKTRDCEAFTSVNGVSFAFDSKSMFQFFCEVFPDEIFEHLVNETNRYAENFLAKATLKPHSTYKKWFSTTLLEMKTFVGIKLLMGIIQKA